MKTVTLVAAMLVASGMALGDTVFKGEVTDINGAAISGAMVLIHWDSAGSAVGLTANVGIRKDLITKTDDNGSFVVELPPGFYDVFASATAFTPACRKIRVAAPPRPPLIFRLNVDPLVAKELGTEVLPKLPKR
jgi:hypothetical protein